MHNSMLYSDQISSLKYFFKTEFDPQKIHRIARSTKLIQRSTSKIKGIELLHGLLESSLEPKRYSLEGIADAMHQHNPEAYLSKQGLSQRINKPECTLFFKTIYQECLSVISKKIASHILSSTDLRGKSLLNLFSKVMLIDCTEFPLHSSLHQSFKGTGGPVENAAAMKICTVFDLKSNCFLSTEITDRRHPDQGLGKKLSFQKNSLVMFDLGFFRFSSLRKFKKKDVFLSLVCMEVLIFMPIMKISMH